VFSLFIIIMLAFEEGTAEISKVSSLGVECKLLAQHYYQEFLIELPTITIASTPDSVASVRKSILRLRDLLDVCVFTYPFLSKKDDEIMDIRKLLDDGYAVIGSFKDLEMISHSPKDQEKSQSDVLDWVRKWNNRLADHRWDQFFLNPLPEHCSDRKYNSISGYFWKKAEKKPKSYYTGDQNLARLTYYLCEIVLDDYKLVLEEKDVTELDHDGEFHDFRKTLRAIDYVGTFQKNAKLTESIWASGVDYESLLETIKVVYTDLCILNDEIYSYLRDVEKCESDKKDEMKGKERRLKLKLKVKKEDLNKIWKNLKKKMEEELEFKKLIEKLERALISFE